MVHRYVVSKEKVDVAARSMRQLCCNAIVEMLFYETTSQLYWLSIGFGCATVLATRDAFKSKTKGAVRKTKIGALFYIFTVRPVR